MTSPAAANSLQPHYHSPLAYSQIFSGRRLSNNDASPLPASDIHSSLPARSSYWFKPDKSLPTFPTPMPSHKGAKLVVTLESDFELGQDVLYTNGAGKLSKSSLWGSHPWWFMEYSLQTGIFQDRHSLQQSSFSWPTRFLKYTIHSSWILTEGWDWPHLKGSSGLGLSQSPISFPTRTFELAPLALSSPFQTSLSTSLV